MNSYKRTESLDERLDPQPQNKEFVMVLPVVMTIKIQLTAFLVRSTLTKELWQKASQRPACEEIKFISSLRRPRNSGNKQFPFCYRSTAHFPTWNMIFGKLTPDSLLASTHYITNNRQQRDNVGLAVYMAMIKIRGKNF